MTNVYALTADAYGFYEDGTESGSAQVGASTTPLTRMVASNSNILVRIRFSETGGGAIAGAATDDYKIQRSLNSTTVFADVTTTSTVAKVFTTSQLTDEGATTNRLGAGGGSFVAGRQEDGNGEITNYAGSANSFTELVYAVTLVAADVAEADVIRFRVLLNNATTNMTYTAVPTINVTKAVSFTAEPTTAALTATGQAPTVAASALLEPTTAALVATGQAPTFAAHFTADPNIAALVITGLAPTVSAGLSERLTPNTVLASTNLKDSASNNPPQLLTDIDEETGSPDGLWWTAVNPEADIAVRLGFPTSTGNLVGTQTFRAVIRGTSLPSRDWKLELYEGGVKKTSESTNTTTSLTSQLITLTFPATELTNQTGADAEIRISATAA